MKVTKELKRYNNGITLVALVITIIVLLILAGVGIGAIAGEDGLIAKAKQAAEQYNQSSEEEAQTVNELLNILEGENQTTEGSTTSVTIVSSNISMTNFTLTATATDSQSEITNYKFYINGSLYSTQETTEETSSINVTVEPTTYVYNCYVIVTNGEGKIKQSETIEVKPIITIYGEEVIYSPTNGATENWKIFYADSENIYLIASDYVENQYAPNAADGTPVNKTEGSKYQINFNDIVNNGAYTGTLDIRTEDARVKKWISHVDKFTSEYANMKATAYLLDTSIWSEFKDVYNKAQYAIGGPTLELFIESYNDIHEIDLNYELTEQTGYKVKWNTDTTNNDEIILDATESLYVIADDTNAIACWIPSPSDLTDYFVFAVNYYGVLGNSSYNGGADGFRPIICLKSSVQLIEQADGRYIIQ